MFWVWVQTLLGSIVVISEAFWSWVFGSVVWPTLGAVLGSQFLTPYQNHGRMALAFVNLFVDVTTLKASLFVLFGTALTCFSIRMVLFVYHQFWGSN